MRCRNILEAVGRTPLVRLNRLTEGLRAEVYVKVDYLNPGGSVKDRIALTMIEDAERRGLLQPGGTIIEGTSGNTGMGLALVAAVKGYKVIFTITDKQSREKIDLLRALGAEVVVCPTAVAPDDPRSYYSVARKLSQEIPNSYYPNQYENPMNPEAHYRTTGPEIWEDSEGKITHFVAGLGTGGTASGTARYLKEKNPNVKMVGADPIGSLYYEFFTTGKVGQAATYLVEGIGEDIFPSTMDFSLVDEIIQVTDRDCFLCARQLARAEGIFTGGAGGGAVFTALEVAKRLGPEGFVVAFLPDTGMRYLSKVYSDTWMRDHQFLERPIELRAEDLLRDKAAARPLLSVRPEQTAYHALRLMDKEDISQLPVFENGTPVGALYEDHLVELTLKGRDLRKVEVRDVMERPLPIVPPATPIDQLSYILSERTPAVLVEAGPGRYEILTKYDIIRGVTNLIEKQRKE